MTLHKVPPSAISYGDQVLINQHLCTVKLVDGPDTVGAYDVYAHDETTGADVRAIVTETITLAL